MRTEPLRRVRVWDWPTRVFHWSLVVLLICAWASHHYAVSLGDTLLRWHRWNGYAILVLMVFRLIWGFWGASTARFSTFLYGPKFLIRYVQDLLAGRKRAFLGHNPLGALMVIALLALVLTQGLLGLFTLEHNGIVAGPLKRLLSDEWVAMVSKLHLKGFNLIMLLVGVHILANVAYGAIAREPLIRAMVSGEKPATPYEDAAAADIPAQVTVRAFIAFIAALVVVFGGIIMVGGRF